MKYKKTSQGIIIKIVKGEKVMEELKKFCEAEGIKNGWFTGIGAPDWAEIAHYSVVDKKYSSFVLEEALEMISLIGNVFLGLENELIIHAHISVGRPDGEMRGGHLVEARVGGACEIMFTPIETSLGKKFDEETGLKILEI